MVDYTNLTRMAREEAAKRMRGRPIGIYEVDDIAQEMLMKYLLISKTERIAKPGALLGELAFQASSNAGRREKKRRMDHPDFDRIAADCLVVQRWEGGDVVEETIDSLLPFAKNDAQRGILLHARLGLDDTDAVDRLLMQRCLGVTNGGLSTQKFRLKAAILNGRPLLTPIVTTPGARRCECTLFRENVLSYLRFLIVKSQHDESFRSSSEEDQLSVCSTEFDDWAWMYGQYIPIVRADPLWWDVDDFLDGNVVITTAFHAFRKWLAT